MMISKRNFVLCLLCLLYDCLAPTRADSATLVAELTGTFPGDAATGDLFGVTLTITDQKDTLVVSAPAANVPNASGVEQVHAGALYFFREGQDGEWEQSQAPFSIPVTRNSVGSVIIVSRNGWLMAPALGTPLNVPAPKDNSGAVLAFRRHGNQWELSQIIPNPVPLPASFFSFFGLNLDYDGGDWMVVGGANVPTGYVYKLNKATKQWEFWQALALPADSNVGPGYVFPAISKDKLVISEPMSIDVDRNGRLFAYKRIGNTWTYFQTLQGTVPGLDPVYQVGDFLGNFLDMDRNWLLAAASWDHERGSMTGAAYFYHYEQGQWVQKQKVFSDQPNVLFGFGLSIEDKVAVVSDTGRQIGGNVFQGAGVMYELHKGEWVASPELLIDPHGRAYDFLGGGGVEVNEKMIALGSDTVSDIYLPDGFPGKRPTTVYTQGRAVLYEIDN